MSDPTVLDPAQRSAALAAASAEEHDVVVIGAGATGTGAALDAAARGLSVVLVEAGDIASGTSSRSGKTFHGGLRYLEQLNFGLVNSALHERNLMVNRLCPFLATPEPFLYPLTKHWERPYIGAGIALYDAMTLTTKGVPHHHHFTHKGVLREAPALDPDLVVGGIRYHDVRIDDARHTMMLARTAAGLGAHVISRARVVEVLRSGDRVAGVVIEDGNTGVRHRIRARVVISAAGVWSARIQEMAGQQTFRIQPAKGVHVVLPKSALDSRTGLFARAEDSVIIIRKWGDYWMLGTTDTPYTGDLAAPRAEDHEIEYLLRNINRYLRTKISRDQIVGTFAGLRPLLAPLSDDPDATSALARDHSVIPGPDGLITIVGGKYTTYRAMAADAVDAAAAQLGRPVPASLSEELPVVGTDGWRAVLNRADALGREFGVPAEQVRRLVGRYGALTPEVLRPALADPAWGRPVEGAPGFLAAEYRYAVTHEGASTLADVLWRRTHVSFETPDGGYEAAAGVAGLIGPQLGWDAGEQARQVSEYRDWIRSERAAIQEPAPSRS
ncbi:MAG TPA: glycerol-3-phosphate dehydrogenase/oxidase, partial [Mycobacteriales bacterium]|nr:glycerol-3-phosphate dehydrogenase/oxidase [Mycobacteriales bacterium]